jgi:hypothetical protein
MPFFDPDDARALQTENLETDAELDLSGLKKDAALVRLAESVGLHRALGTQKLTILFDKASATSGETLFQPIGRFLKAELAAGRIVRAMPALEGGGWVVRLRNEVDDATRH